MLDDSLPLTPGEWNEWGNPITDPAAFRYMLSYSALRQCPRQAYPPMLITGGLNDPRVTYWEPAKWAARLRAMRTDNNLQLLKINMGAGHGGQSGRWTRLREVAEAYAFILTQMGGAEAAAAVRAAARRPAAARRLPARRGQRQPDAARRSKSPVGPRRRQLDRRLPLRRGGAGLGVRPLAADRERRAALAAAELDGRDAGRAARAARPL